MSELSLLLETIGEDATVTLIEAFGGTRLDVPKLPTRQQRSDLKKLLGEETFKRLHRHFGGTRIFVPLAKRWRFAVYDRKGLTKREMAQRLHCTEGTVYSLQRARKRQPAGQAELVLE